MIKLRAAASTWRVDGVCGRAVMTVSSSVALNLTCSGPGHAFFRDTDGSLFQEFASTATPSIRTGQFGAAGRTFPYDQGTAAIPGPCVYSSPSTTYSCLANSNAFLLDPSLKPTVLPPKGIFGAPSHFVLESRDDDSATRNFGPVMFNVSGSVDVVLAAMSRVSPSACRNRRSLAVAPALPSLP